MNDAYLWFAVRTETTQPLNQHEENASKQTNKHYMNSIIEWCFILKRCRATCECMANVRWSSNMACVIVRALRIPFVHLNFEFDNDFFFVFIKPGCCQWRKREFLLTYLHLLFRFFFTSLVAPSTCLFVHRRMAQIIFEYAGGGGGGLRLWHFYENGRMVSFWQHENMAFLGGWAKRETEKKKSEMPEWKWCYVSSQK